MHWNGIFFKRLSCIFHQYSLLTYRLTMLQQVCQSLKHSIYHFPYESSILFILWTKNIFFMSSDVLIRNCCVTWTRDWIVPLALWHCLIFYQNYHRVSTCWSSKGLPHRNCMQNLLLPLTVHYYLMKIQCTGTCQFEFIYFILSISN